MPQVLYLSRHDVETVGLGMAEIIELVAFTLREHAQRRTQMPPKPGVHPRPGSLLHAMPAYVERAGACGLKWVSAFPANKDKGLPNITGLIILNDPATGVPQVILDASWITAMRTAASAAVAARCFARAESEVMGLLGAGVQGRTNLAALKLVLPRLKRVRAWGPRRETVERYRQEMEGEHGVQVDVAASAQEAVSDADVLVTAAPWPRASGAAPVQPAWIAPGLFACALDFDASLSADAVAAFDRRACDDPSTLEYYRAQGTFAAWAPMEELGAVVAGLQPPREDARQRILSVNLGLGIYDVVVAKRVGERARELGIGAHLGL